MNRNHRRKPHWSKIPRRSQPTIVYRNGDGNIDFLMRMFPIFIWKNVDGLFLSLFRPNTKHARVGISNFSYEQMTEHFELSNSLHVFTMILGVRCSFEIDLVGPNDRYAQRVLAVLEKIRGLSLRRDPQHMNLQSSPPAFSQTTGKVEFRKRETWSLVIPPFTDHRGERKVRGEKKTNVRHRILDMQKSRKYDFEDYE